MLTPRANPIKHDVLQMEFAWVAPMIAPYLWSIHRFLREADIVSRRGQNTHIQALSSRLLSRNTTIRCNLYCTVGTNFLLICTPQKLTFLKPFVGLCWPLLSKLFVEDEGRYRSYKTSRKWIWRKLMHISVFLIIFIFIDTDAAWWLRY